MERGLCVCPHVWRVEGGAERGSSPGSPCGWVKWPLKQGFPACLSHTRALYLFLGVSSTSPGTQGPYSESQATSPWCWLPAPREVAEWLQDLGPERTLLPPPPLPAGVLLQLSAVARGGCTDLRRPDGEGRGRPCLSSSACRTGLDGKQATGNYWSRLAGFLEMGISDYMTLKSFPGRGASELPCLYFSRWSSSKTLLGVWKEPLGLMERAGCLGPLWCLYPMLLSPEAGHTNVNSRKKPRVCVGKPAFLETLPI